MKTTLVVYVKSGQTTVKIYSSNDMKYVKYSDMVVAGKFVVIYMLWQLKSDKI